MILLLFQTKFRSAGTPILTEGFRVVRNIDDAPYYDGFEPVNFFCGGTAVDVNMNGAWGADNTQYPKTNQAYWSDHAFIYFKPSVQYTSGTEYIGGLAFITGTNIEGLAEDLGWKIFSETDLSGHQYFGVIQSISFLNRLSDESTKKECMDLALQTTKTYLVYTKTFNPYRAIYDIKTYTAEQKVASVIYNVSYGGLGYTACEVLQQGTGNPGDTIGSDNRTVRATHAYR